MIFSSFDTIISIMKGFGLTLVILVVSIFYLDAFLPHPQPHHHWQRQTTKQSPSASGRVTIRPNGSLKLQEKPSKDNALPAEFSHADILWKVRPPPETPPLKKLWLRFAANVIRLECKVKRQEPPLVLTPRTGQAVLEAYYRRSDDDSDTYVKIGRFGFTTERGPPAPPIQESVHDIYGLDTNIMVGVAAIIYMFVEPEYRKKEVGTLALQVVSLIHAIQGCDFTVLVVDDNGSGKLIEWYEQKGYSKAPKLQNMLGSPNAINGITMMAPTQRILPEGCHIQWW